MALLKLLLTFETSHKQQQYGCYDEGIFFIFLPLLT